MQEQIKKKQTIMLVLSVDNESNIVFANIF